MGRYQEPEPTDLQQAVGSFVDDVCQRVYAMRDALPASAERAVVAALLDVRRLADDRFGERPPYHGKQAGGTSRANGRRA